MAANGLKSGLNLPKPKLVSDCLFEWYKEISPIGKKSFQWDWALMDSGLRILDSNMDLDPSVPDIFQV